MSVIGSTSISCYWWHVVAAANTNGGDPESKHSPDDNPHQWPFSSPLRIESIIIERFSCCFFAWSC